MPCHQYTIHIQSMTQSNTIKCFESIYNLFWSKITTFGNDAKISLIRVALCPLGIASFSRYSSFCEVAQYKVKPSFKIIIFVIYKAWRSIFRQPIEISKCVYVSNSIRARTNRFKNSFNPFFYNQFTVIIMFYLVF